MVTKSTKLLFALAIIFASFNINSVMAAASLIDNGGFESYVSGETAEDWNFYTDGSPDTYFAGLATDNVAEGTYSQRLSQDGSTFEDNELSIESDTQAGAVPGQSLELTFKSNVTSLAGAKLLASVKFWDVNNDYIGKFPMEVKAATSGFESYSHTVVIPAGAVDYAVGFEAQITVDGGYYNLYIDDVSLAVSSSSADQTKVGITGGDLVLSTVSGSFADIEINNDWSQLETTMRTTASIIDNRASGEGWAVKISATDFLSQSLADPSSNGSSQFVLKIPVTSLRLATSSINHISGQAIDPVNGPLVSSFTVSNSSQTFVQAKPGFGMGSYQIPIDYTLAIPKTLEIVSQTGTGSEFSVGEYVGARRGEYTATLNFTAGVGL